MKLTRALVLLFAGCPGAFAAEPSNAPTAPAQAPALQAAPLAPAAPTLGRLFFSPQERAALDESRRRPAVVAAPEPKPLPPAPEYVTLNGVVRRSDGSTAIWLNNRLLDGRRTVEGVEVTDSKRAPGPANVTVRVPQAGRSVDLRVGQQLDVTSGKVQERYQLAPEAAAPSQMSPAGAPSASAKSAPARRPTRDRELLRELLRDVEGPQAERPQPPADAKG